MFKSLFFNFYLLCKWVEEATSAIILFCSVVLFYCAVIYYQNEFCVRLIGFVFQAIGYVCSFVVLRRAEVYYQFPGFKERILSWVKGFPFLKKEEIHANVDVVLPSMEGYGEAHHTFIPLSGELSNRIKAVEDYIPFIEGQITHVKKTVDLRINGVENNFYIERNIRISRDQKLEDMLKNGAIGSAVLIETGLAYFFIGAIASSFPSDIIRWLN